MLTCLVPLFFFLMAVRSDLGRLSSLDFVKNSFFFVCRNKL